MQATYSAYYLAVTAEDALLDARLAAIRVRQDTGQATTRQTADERVAALQEHLTAVAALRERYL